ncbi:MAG: carbohydrate ABC transporter permease [Geminicoccaceae bacterium]
MLEQPWHVRATRYGLVAVACLWSLVPILLVILASLKEPKAIFEFPPSLIFTPTVDNYVRLWTAWPGFFADLRNSLIVTTGATLLTVLVSSAAGYVYARYSSTLLTLSAFFMVVVRMLPPIIITLPLFPVVNWLRLNDTHILLILLYATFFVSLSTWIMRAFIKQIPFELEEAAIIDGATLTQRLLRVVLPVAAQGIAAAAIFVLIFSWNEYIFALIFTTRNAKTAPVIIGEMLGTAEGVEWGVLFAAASIQLLPILIFVILVQRLLIAGLTAGSMKG